MLVTKKEVAEAFMYELQQTRRLFKKAMQQGRSERRGDEVRTALRVSRSLLEWILVNG